MSEPYNAGKFPTLTPYIVVRDGAAAIAFYEKAFGAVARDIAHTPDGKIMNAQLQVGDSVLMLNDEFPDYGVLAPQPGERVHTTLHISSQSVDEDFQRAIDAGAEVTMPLADMFWGDRYGALTDPFGYKWSMGQKMRDLTQDEMMAEMGKETGL
ncbi:MAG: VOC family protein [Armatimonadetes bacterium]|nr:VOC family protein [Armatimonadota bacterium]